MRGDLEYPLSKQRSLERGGGYCYLLLCIDFRNNLILNMKKNQKNKILFFNCSVYFIYIDFHSIMIFFMYVRCYD